MSEKIDRSKLQATRIVIRNGKLEMVDWVCSQCGKKAESNVDQKSICCNAKITKK